MRVILGLAFLVVSLLMICSACQSVGNDLSLRRESPSYVVKKFWQLAQENDLEKASQLVSKSGIDVENDYEKQDEFQTPGFINILHNSDDRMQSICECDADAAIFTKVLLKVEKEGTTKVFKFILSDQNAKKIWKIVWVSEAESSDSECN